MGRHLVMWPKTSECQYQRYTAGFLHLHSLNVRYFPFSETTLMTCMYFEAIVVEVMSYESLQKPK